MGKVFRVRVYGKPRRRIDPERLVQVLIAFARHVARQRQQHPTNATDADQERIVEVPQPRRNPGDST